MERYCQMLAGCGDGLDVREEEVKVSLAWGRGEVGPVTERREGTGEADELCLGHSDLETCGNPHAPEDMMERLKLRTEL